MASTKLLGVGNWMQGLRSMNSKAVVIISAIAVTMLLFLPITVCLADAASSSSTQLDLDGMPQDDIDEADQILTNGRLRAEAGSLSRFSVKSSLMYFAGTIEKPFDAERPNISGGNETQDVLQNLNGTVGVKYRASSRSSVHLDGGLKMLTPFNRSVKTSDETLRQQFDDHGGKMVMYDPTIGYSYMFRAFGTQNYLEFGQVYITDPVLREVGVLTASSLMHAVAYELGASKFTVGMEWGVVYQWFDKSAEIFGADQTQYQFGFFPSLEYAITDRVIARTVLGVVLEHTREFRDPLMFRRDLVYQSVGVGFSLTRDIYIYPNVQFLPGDIQGNKTNVALQTFLNVF